MAKKEQTGKKNANKRVLTDLLADADPETQGEEDGEIDPSLARKIWLAGLGAYGRAVNDAADGMAKVSQETARAFEELAKKGADLEEQSGKPKERIKVFDRPPIEERLSHFRAALGLGGAKSTDARRIAELEAQVKGLKAQVEELMRALDDAGD